MAPRALTALAVALLMTGGLPSAAGADTNWVAASMNGQPVTVDLGPGSDVATGMAVQPDGKIVVVGTADVEHQAGHSSIAVLRFGSDGRLDPTFGDHGRLLVDNGGHDQAATAVTLQPDGDIVVVGYDTVSGPGGATMQAAVVRVDSAGRPDANFGAGGTVTLPGLADSGGGAVALQPDGKIVVAGSGRRAASTDQILVARFNANGSPDGTLTDVAGDVGFTLLDLGGYRTEDAAVFVGLRPDGRIVVAGNSAGASSSALPGNTPVVAQISAGGALDPTFGTGGVGGALVPSGISRAVLRSDGTLVTVGAAYSDPKVTIRSSSFAVTAYTVNGAVDPRFGAAGTIVTPAPPTTRSGGVVALGNGAAAAVAVDHRGRLVVAGGVTGFMDGDLAVTRYSGLGALDRSFGRAGWIKTDIGGAQDELDAVGMLPDGSIAAAGRSATNNVAQIAFVVYPSTDRPAPAKAWGWNALGQLGDGSVVDRSTAVSVAGPANTAVVAAGVLHSVALDDAGAVYAWGWNGVGQLGDGTTADHVQPAAVPGLTGVTTIAAGYFHSLAVQSGVVQAWGWNPLGQLGDGTGIDRARPVPVLGLDHVVAVAAGAFHSLALRSDGTVWAWGWNGEGELGTGSRTQSLRPVQVPGLTDVVAIAAGAYNSLALTSDGTIYDWGWNGLGQLDDTTTTDGLLPAKLMGPGFVAIAAGGLHDLALTGDGAVWGWGYNGLGEVGDGTVVSPAHPEHITGLPETNAIAAGMLHSAAVGVDHRVWGWGWNAVGQVGDGTTVDRHSPVPTAGPVSASAVAAGAHHTLAL